MARLTIHLAGDALWFRCLFGWLGPPHVKLVKKTQTETIRRLYEQHHVIQDMLIPMGALGDAINTFHDEVLRKPTIIINTRIEIEQVW